MSSFVGIGFSQAPDPAQAAKEAAIKVKNQLNLTAVDLVIVFITVEYVHADILEIIHRILQPVRLVGCSSAGIILADQIETRGIGICAISSNEIQFGTGTIHDIDPANLYLAGFNLARDTSDHFPHFKRNAFIFFADSQLKNNSVFIRGAQEVLGSGFPIIGAVTTGNLNFTKSYQIFHNKIYSNGASGFLIGGQGTVVLGSQHGWRPLGKPRTVDKVEGHIIQLIDDRPAVEIYEDYLGESLRNVANVRASSFAVLYPLGVYIEEENRYLLRNVIDILVDGSIVCQGEVPQGAEVHVMIGNKETLKQAVLDAAYLVRDGLFGRQAKLILVIESVMRHKILGRQAIQEVEIIKEILGYTTPMIGLYSCGEISPFGSLVNTKNTHLQNESIVLVALG